MPLGDSDFARKKMSEKIRDLLDTAMDDPQTKQTQLDMVDEFFGEMAGLLPTAIENTLRQIFNVVSAGQPVEIQSRGFVRAISGTDIGLVLHQEIPINTRYTDFDAADIRRLPNYLKLHEAARAADVAINVMGLFQDEAMEAGLRPTLVVNITKTYEEGLAQNPGVYPELQDAAQDIQELPEVPQATLSPARQKGTRFKL